MTLDIINHLINISDIRHKTLSITPGPILVQGKKLRFFLTVFHPGHLAKAITTTYSLQTQIEM